MSTQCPMTILQWALWTVMSQTVCERCRVDWRGEETFSSVSHRGQRFVPQCFISPIFPVWASMESWKDYISAAIERKTLVLRGDVTGVPKMQWTQGVPEKLISQVPGMEQKLWPTALDTVRLKGSGDGTKSCLIEWVNIECLLVLLGASSKCYWSITYN